MPSQVYSAQLHLYFSFLGWSSVRNFYKEDEGSRKLGTIREIQREIQDFEIIKKLNLLVKNKQKNTRKSATKILNVFASRLVGCLDAYPFHYQFYDNIETHLQNIEELSTTEIPKISD